MHYGPLQLATHGPNHSPMKQLHGSMAEGSQTILFDTTLPYPLQPNAPEFLIDTVLTGNGQAATLALVHQFQELSSNAEWQRAGLFLTMREDGFPDGMDGWYVASSYSVDERRVISGFARPQITVKLRGRRKESIGVFADSKLVPNDAALGGTTLAAFPAGLDLTKQFPGLTYTLTGRTAAIGLVENPAMAMQAPVLNYIDLMQLGRCRVMDETADGSSTATEVFWKDHRNLNGYWRIDNDLARYSVTPGASPVIDRWDGAAWVTTGTYQLRVTNVGAVLPVQSVAILRNSPDEVVWSERRYDAAATALVVVINRIRRGWPAIESQIIAASGAGLTGTTSVALTTLPAGPWATTRSADGSGVVWVSGNSQVPGFGYLTAPTSLSGASAGVLYSGLQVPAGTVARINIVAGYKDVVWTACASDGATYAAKVASIGRQRVKQRILIDV